MICSILRVEQKVYDIAGVKVGGNVGENPTVMIGSIFYKGDKTVRDEKTGSFNRERAEELISKVEEISDRTGLPAMLDVVCSNPENARNYLEFAADVTSMLILIDALSLEAALTRLESAKKLGIVERTIFNSINPETKQQIYMKIREVGLDSAIGADFILYGPIKAAEHIFPAISLIDASYGQLLIEEEKRSSPNHPRFKIAHQ